MVHLGKVTNDSEVKKEKEASNGIDMSKLGPEGSSAGDFETSIYGSRFAGEDLPSHEMPEGEMPAATAYRMITLDGNPTLKYILSQPFYAAPTNESTALPRSSQPTWSPRLRSS
jgi:glutamate decarboxylase